MGTENLTKRLAKEELQRRASQRDGLGLSVDDSVFLNPGPEHEVLDCDLRGKELPAKLLAYYLPQFYPFDENNKWWGTGFTEWHNTTRARPRFQGHYQPHLPADLGYYDLRNVDIMHQQAELAQRAGIHAWCFYYYRFGEKRLLDLPVNNFLDNPGIEMPFCLMWANQNWTRAWDGGDQEILMAQDYDVQHDDGFISDLARHFQDPRYLKLDGKPLFYIYNPSDIPEANKTIDRWRELLMKRYQIDVSIHMVQYKTRNPHRFGLDGAIEFPPHKLNANLESLNKHNYSELPLLDKTFTGNFFRYSDLVQNSLIEPIPDFDMVKCLVPNWDCEARRPNRAVAYTGSTPDKYEDWLNQLIKYARANPVQGEAIVAINAWNEWAEGAHLEPDVYYGSAYLNATARALLKNID